MQAIAGELVSRGHRATFLQQIDAGRLIQTPGMEFQPVGLRSHPTGELDRIVGRINGMVGLRGLPNVLRDLARGTDMLCREVPAMLRQHNVDAIVADQTEAAGGLIARHLRLPYVSVANALPINGEPGVPPPFTAWHYDPTNWGRRRNAGGYRVARLLMWRMRTVIGRYATDWELAPLRALEDCLSPQAQLSQIVRTLDFPRESLPPGFCYTGPFRDAAEDAIPFPASIPAAPLIFATLGTLQGNRIELFRTIAQACWQMGLHCLIAHGGRLSAAQVTSLPGAPLVFDFVPQRAVLRQAVAAVTHGGMNTVLDALSVGVPIVAVPLAFEQAAIAARVAHAGVGRIVKARGLQVATLVEALTAVVENPSYRASARLQQNQIVTAGGARRAADIIEACVDHPM